MARRSAVADAVPTRLLVYRPADWPSTEAWRVARCEWMANRQPATLAELNQVFYGPGVVLAPRPDPREVPYGA